MVIHAHRSPWIRETLATAAGTNRTNRTCINPHPIGFSEGTLRLNVASVIVIQRANERTLLRRVEACEPNQHSSDSIIFLA